MVTDGKHIKALHPLPMTGSQRMIRFCNVWQHMAKSLIRKAHLHCSQTSKRAATMHNLSVIQLEIFLHSQKVDKQFQEIIEVLEHECNKAELSPLTRYMMKKDIRSILLINR